MVYVTLDVVKNMGLQVKLDGSFGHGKFGNSETLASIVDRNQGVFIDEVKEWQRVPVLFVPARETYAFFNLLPSIASLNN